MKNSLGRAITIVAVLAVTPVGASAAMDLTSDQLRGGPGGIVCSCMNRSSETIVVRFAGQSSGTSTFDCDNRSIRPGAVQACGFVGSALQWSCRVSRVDRTSASVTDLACTLAAFDAQGSPLAVIPVDTSRRR